jgi:hypothetical protein
MLFQALAAIVPLDGAGAIDCTIRDCSDSGTKVALKTNGEFAQNFYFINVKERTGHLASVAWKLLLRLGSSSKTASR